MTWTYPTDIETTRAKQYVSQAHPVQPHLQKAVDAAAEAKAKCTTAWREYVLIKMIGRNTTNTLHVQKECVLKSPPYRLPLNCNFQFNVRTPLSELSAQYDVHTPVVVQTRLHQLSCD